MRLTDDELLQQLGAAFAPEPQLEPPPERVAALRRTVADHHEPARPGPVAWLRRGAQRGTILLAAGGLVVGGATAAAAATGHVPEPIRALAHDLGLGTALPATPTIDQLAALRRALQQHDQAKVSALIEQLHDRARNLPTDELARLTDEVDTMLRRAGMTPANPDLLGETPAGPSASTPSDTSPTPSDGSSTDSNPTPEPTAEPPTTAAPDTLPTTDTTPPTTEPSGPPTGAADSPPPTTDTALTSS